MYTLEDVYKTFPSGCTEDYKILRAFEMGKQASEKQIEELKDELKALRESIKDYGAGCYENGLRNGKRKLEEQIADLEKENAGLKAQLESERDLPAIAYMQGAEKQKKKDEEQLIKAREIVKEFVEWATWQGSNCPNFKSIQDKAEQFLKESE